MSSGDRISLGVFFIFSVLFLVFEARVAIGFFTKKDSGYFVHYTKRRWMRIIAGIGAFLAIAAAIDGYLVEPDWVVHEHLSLQSPKVTKKIRIVQISDLHTESYGRRHERALDLIQKANPDIIVLTGDYLNGRDMQYLPELRKFVSGLQAPHGIYAIEGNFDFNQRPFEMFEEIGVKVLENDTVHIDDLNISICGLSCVWNLGEPEKEFLRETQNQHPESYLVLLSHYPNHIEEPQIACTDLYLCGHTHGGQIRLPLWGAIVTLSKHGKKYECGHYLHGNIHVYVNRGLGMEGGFAPRVRFLCRPEITVIDICPAESK